MQFHFWPLPSCKCVPCLLFLKIVLDWHVCLIAPFISQSMLYLGPLYDVNSQNSQIIQYLFKTLFCFLWGWLGTNFVHILKFTLEIFENRTQLNLKFSPFLGSLPYKMRRNHEMVQLFFEYNFEYDNSCLDLKQDSLSPKKTAQAFLKGLQSIFSKKLNSPFLRWTRINFQVTTKLCIFWWHTRIMHLPLHFCLHDFWANFPLYKANFENFLNLANHKFQKLQLLTSTSKHKEALNSLISLPKRQMYSYLMRLKLLSPTTFIHRGTYSHITPKM